MKLSIILFSVMACLNPFSSYSQDIAIKKVLNCHGYENEGTVQLQGNLAKDATLLLKITHQGEDAVEVIENYSLKIKNIDEKDSMNCTLTGQGYGKSNMDSETIKIKGYTLVLNFTITSEDMKHGLFKPVSLLTLKKENMSSSEKYHLSCTIIW